MNAYEQKQAARKARLERAAALAADRSAAAIAGVRRVADGIPFGQPILVGHHSEARHRRDADRIHRGTARAVEESRRAEELSRRAAGVGRHGISSDDPDAIAKLEAQVATLRGSVALARQINAALRKHAKAGADAQAAALTALGLMPTTIRLVMEQGRAYAAPAPKIRRLEQRIAELRAKAAAPKRAPIEGDGYTITEDRDANRVQIRFAARPPAVVVAVLKSRGFRWAPSLGVWQRQAGAVAWRAAQDVVAAMPRDEAGAEAEDETETCGRCGEGYPAGGSCSGPGYHP